MNKVSIIFGHYSETQEREALAIRSLESMQQFRNADCELIISANGHYGDTLKQYADKYIERDADLSSGRTFNVAVKQAEGDIFFFTANDMELEHDAISQCVEIVTKYPKHLATPVYPMIRKHHELPPVDGYAVNERIGSGCFCMTRTQWNDIGPQDEKMIYFDMVNYINRWIDKGYAVMATKRRAGRDIGQGKPSSFENQKKEHNIRLWRKREPIYDTSNLTFNYRKNNYE